MLNQCLLQLGKFTVGESGAEPAMAAQPVAAGGGSGDSSLDSDLQERLNRLRNG